MPFSQENVDQLECHFKWKPEEGDIDGDPPTIIEHLLKNFDENPDIKMLSLAIIGYLYAKTIPCQYDKAISVYDEIYQDCIEVEEDRYEEYKGYEMIALHNKVNVLWLLDKQEEAEDLFKALPAYDKLSDKGRATMYGCHGYALSLFGKSKFRKSIEMYQKATELDPDCYSWHFGLGFVCGRERRVEEGVWTEAGAIEESSLEKAVQLTRENKSLPLVFLADIYFFKGREFKGKKSKGNPLMLKKAMDLYEKAFALDPHAPHVLKRCGKAFQITGDVERALTCLLEAMELDPHSSMTIHRLGQMFEFDETLKDPKKAEEYYEKAVTAGRRRNFYAELNLARIRHKMNSSYSKKEHYEDMKRHYLFDEERLEILEGLIQTIDDYQKSNRGNRRSSRGRGGRGGRTSFP